MGSSRSVVIVLFISTMQCCIHALCVVRRYLLLYVSWKVHLEHVRVEEGQGFKFSCLISLSIILKYYCILLMSSTIKLNILPLINTFSSNYFSTDITFCIYRCRVTALSLLTFVWNVMLFLWYLKKALIKHCKFYDW